MDVTGMFLTHAIAHNQRKSAFFFSRFKFRRIRDQDNTHYCFHCGSDWGFTPGKDGTPLKCEDPKVRVSKDGVDMIVRDAINDPFFRELLTREPGYQIPEQGSPRYDEWLEYQAYFAFGPALAAFAEKNGYTIHRHNPMKSHDPKTHADGIIGCADKYDDVWDWLGNEIPKNFPYVVSIN